GKEAWDRLIAPREWSLVPNSGLSPGRPALERRLSALPGVSPPKKLGRGERWKDPEGSRAGPGTPGSAAESVSDDLWRASPCFDCCQQEMSTEQPLPFQL